MRPDVDRSEYRWLRRFFWPAFLGISLASFSISKSYLSPVRPSESTSTESRQGAEERLRLKMRAGIPAEERREVYRTFKKELTGYRLRGFVLGDAVDRQRVRKDLQGKTSFDELKLRYAALSKTIDSTRIWRPEHLWDFLGPRGTEIIASLQVGQISAVPSRDGLYLIQVLAIEDSFEQLAPVIDELLYRTQKGTYSLERQTSDSGFAGSSPRPKL